MKGFLNKLEAEHTAKAVLPVDTNNVETFLNSKFAKVSTYFIKKMQ